MQYIRNLYLFENNDNMEDVRYTLECFCVFLHPEYLVVDGGNRAFCLAKSG